MRIEKDNIVIRSATIDDAVQLNKWWNDVKVMEHAGFPSGLGESLEDTIDNIRSWEGKLSQLCIVEIDGKLVGELSYRIEGDNVEIRPFEEFDYKLFVDMFYSYFLHNFHIKLQYSQIEEICSDIIKMVKNELYFSIY